MTPELDEVLHQIATTCPQVANLLPELVDCALNVAFEQTAGEIEELKAEVARLRQVVGAA